VRVGVGEGSLALDDGLHLALGPGVRLLPRQQAVVPHAAVLHPCVRWVGMVMRVSSIWTNPEIVVISPYLRSGAPPEHGAVVLPVAPLHGLHAAGAHLGLHAHQSLHAPHRLRRLPPHARATHHALQPDQPAQRPVVPPSLHPRIGSTPRQNQTQSKRSVKKKSNEELAM
jgi:hypothetical protein